jgi:hypothetical protein
MFEKKLAWERRPKSSPSGAVADLIHWMNAEAFAAAIRRLIWRKWSRSSRAAAYA